ncbi:solute carrier family 22 member 16 isoform X2 [Mastomys coucha]|uniref:solute carrier family 22 member 16 isoform X2 n=1 Tax=Mastomys coucha TaxID=35658 RepID=UPI0012618177|nr:solute carrier family 22 member 16 isoform X2 [Mastomys coucha]
MESCNVELIFDHVGHFGSFQKVLYLVCAYQSISCGIHYLSSVLMSIIPEHACKPPGMVRKAVFHNVSAWRLEDILALRSPEHKGHIMVELQDGEIWELTRCSRMWRENTSHLGYEYSGYKRDSPCSDGYVYDQSKWRNSVVKSFNLVCDQKWYASIIQPLFIFGVLLGSITFSYLSDRFGRRLALWCTSIGVFFFGIASLFIFDYFSFMVVRFFLVTAASGYFVVVFVYVMEIIGKKSRTWASMQLNTFFAIGAMLVALASYLVSTWWLYQITLCILTSPFIMCCWMLPETPFWLLSEGRYKEAQGTVDAMAVWNQSRSCDLVELLSLDMTRSPDKSPKGVRKHRLADLFYNLDVAKMTLIVWLGWFTANLGYYLFTMEAIRRKENEPLYLLLVGAMEIPAYVFLCIWLKRVGRRKTMLTFLLVSSFICVAYVVMPLNYKTVKRMVALVAKIVIGSVFAFIYLYTAELYPTTVRCLAVGSSNMVSHVASMVILLTTQFSKVWIFLPQILFGILTILSGLLSLKLPETQNTPMTSTWETTEQQVPENKDSLGEAPPVISERQDSGKALSFAERWGLIKAPSGAGKKGSGRAPLEDKSWGSGRAPPEAGKRGLGGASLEDESGGSHRAPPKDERGSSGRVSLEDESWGSGRALPKAEKWGSGRDPPEAESGGSDRALLEAEK